MIIFNFKNVQNGNEDTKLRFFKSETVSTDFNSQTFNTAVLLMYLYCNYLIFYSVIYKVNTVKNFKTLLEII